MTWTDDYKAAMRTFMAAKGRKIEFTGRYPEYPADDDLNVEVYGWVDFAAEYHVNTTKEHGGPCAWVVPEGAILKEKTYSQFTDTVSSNDNEVGINVSGCHCACGKYTDVTLRYVGTVSEVLQSILGIPKDPEVTL